MIVTFCYCNAAEIFLLEPKRRKEGVRVDTKYFHIESTEQCLASSDLHKTHNLEFM
jgi:hypothetical protein